MERLSDRERTRTAEFVRGGCTVLAAPSGGASISITRSTGRRELLRPLAPELTRSALRLSLAASCVVSAQPSPDTT